MGELHDTPIELRRDGSSTLTVAPAATAIDSSQLLTFPSGQRLFQHARSTASDHAVRRLLPHRRQHA